MQILNTARYRSFLLRQSFVMRRTDTVLLSYPKTGTTWLQLLLRRLLIDQFNLGENHIGHVVVGALRDLRPWPPKIPRIFVTHGMFWFNEERCDNLTFEPGRFAQHLRIVLTREPKDTLVSLYFHNRDLTDPPAYSRSVDEMARDPVYGVCKYVEYYRRVYTQLGTGPQTLIVRYEELRRDTVSTLASICQFLRLENVSRERLDRVVAACSFERMKAAEVTGSSYLPAVMQKKNPGESARHMRRGMVGGFRDYLSRETVEYVDNYVQRNLPSEFGYSGSRRVAGSTSALSDG